MNVIHLSGSFIYAASTGDWRLRIGDGEFQILPQVGALTYDSGVNLDNLASLIVAAKAHAVQNGINWEGN